MDSAKGQFHMTLCGKSQDCGKDDSVCVSSGGSLTGIASSSYSRIMVDGERQTVPYLVHAISLLRLSTFLKMLRGCVLHMCSK